MLPKRSQLLAFLLICLVCATLAAQDSATGSLRGTVLDPNGGRIAHASAVVVNVETGTRFTAATNAEGRFTVELLPGTTPRGPKRKGCPRRSRRNCMWT
jgi:carboxypeptidase family protein